MKLTKLQTDILNNRISKEELVSLYKNDLNELINPTYNINNIIEELDKIPDIKKAAEIIKKHVDNKSLIACSIDIDCDGLFSGVVMYNILTRILNVDSSNIIMVVGTRDKGRGVNDFILEKLSTVKTKLNRDIGLIITADHGTTDNANYKKLKEQNSFLDIIVTDHHEIEYENYPFDVDAFINVQREDCTFDKTICGCATVFFTFLYLLHLEKKVDLLREEYLYVGAATSVDMMSMKSRINRFLIKNMITHSLEYEDVNFKIMKKILKLPSIISQRDVNIYIGPLINTANRSSSEVFTLATLITKNEKETLTGFEYLNSLSKYRKLDTFHSVDKLLTDPELQRYKDGISLLADTKFFINGTIASGISNLYRRPTVCFCIRPKNNIYYGSGRSGSDNINILYILKKLQEENPGIIDNVAGHKGACGCNVVADKFELFRSLFNTYSKNYIDTLIIDGVKEEFYLSHQDINIATAADIIECGPYGINWREPVFTSEPFEIVKIIQIRHFFKITLRASDGYLTDAFHFFSQQSAYGITPINIKAMVAIGSKMKLWFKLGLSHFNSGFTTIQLEILDMTTEV